MNKQEFRQFSVEYLHMNRSNHIHNEHVISDSCVGSTMFTEPLVGFAAADDSLFASLQNNEVVGPFHLSPREWLPEAQSVISVFFPFSREVIESNYMNAAPSPIWLQVRREGQKFINDYSEHIIFKLNQLGALCTVPGLDKRYRFDIKETFTSNWSERHVAYICGLGTFSLCKGLITPKGMAGRFCSVITNVYFKPDKRGYKGIYEYCKRCGSCARRCPANAISLENGKSNKICSEYMDITRGDLCPPYACGKCQTKVPCESKTP